MLFEKLIAKISLKTIKKGILEQHAHIIPINIKNSRGVEYYTKHV